MLPHKGAHMKPMTRILLALVVPALVPPGILAATFTVTLANDQPSSGTLRWAIGAANSNAGNDNIEFNLASPYRVYVSNNLPTISGPVTVHGTNQSGYVGIPLVHIMGKTNLDWGLFLATGANHVVKGLQVSRFGSSGIELRYATNGVIENCYVYSNREDGIVIHGSVGCRIGGTNTAMQNTISSNGFAGITIEYGAYSNRVIGNYIGTDPSGTRRRGNERSGVYIQNASMNTIGGSNANCRNVISGNHFYNVEMSGNANSNLVIGNYVGTDSTGTNALGGFDGVFVYGAWNIIGGANTNSRNIISGNEVSGVVLWPSSTVYNVVVGNYIGLDATGTRAVTNVKWGVNIENAHSNTIGGTAAGAGNVISGNGYDGIQLAGVASHNTIVGNLIGLNAAGNASVSNVGWGIRCRAPENTIGGTNPGSRNVISGNDGPGIYLDGPTAKWNQVLGNYIGTDVTGSNAVPNDGGGITIALADNNTIGGTGTARNVISGNGSIGVTITGEGLSGTGNVVYGNFVGVDASGGRGLGNGGTGISISEARGNRIGGGAVGRGNVVSDNGYSGISVTGTNAIGNLVAGNYVGLDASGLVVFTNATMGIDLWESVSNTIGGGNSYDWNYVAGHPYSAVRLYGTNCVRNTLRGNMIGTDITSTNATAGSGYGVYLDSARFNIIGGDEEEGNLISGNRWHGLYLLEAVSNVIRRNYIGLDDSSERAVGNEECGICLESSWGNRIGGTNEGEGNLICASGQDGIRIRYTNSYRNLIYGNYIGCNTMTNDLGNGEAGVLILDGARSNRVGGLLAGMGNVIAYNERQGIYIIDWETNTVGNAIFQNSIFGNRRLGIDLYPEGVTANDDQDPDLGANTLQNYPVLMSASSNGGNLVVVGLLNSVPLRTNLVEIFGNRSVDLSGHGQGETYLNRTLTIALDAGGNRIFTNRVAYPVPPPSYITATAADQINYDTSEFSYRIILDSDGDGMPDGWEYQYFTNPVSASPMADADTDGVVNVSEYLGDTNPRDASSYIRMSSIAQVGGTTYVSWASSGQRLYQCWWNAEVTNPATWWQEGGVSNGTGGTIVMGTPWNTVAARFWRIDARVP